MHTVYSDLFSPICIASYHRLIVAGEEGINNEICKAVCKWQIACVTTQRLLEHEALFLITNK